MDVKDLIVAMKEVGLERCLIVWLLWRQDKRDIRFTEILTELLTLAKAKKEG